MAIISVSLFFALINFSVVFSSPISVVVIYPLISKNDIQAINEIICFSNKSEYAYTVLTSVFTSLDELQSCLFVKTAHALALTYPERQSDIKSNDDARIAALYQNAGALTGIDTIAYHIENADLVLVGSLIYEPPYEFMRFVFSMIPNAPLTIVFSSDLLNTWDGPSIYSSPMSHLVGLVLNGNAVVEDTPKMKYTDLVSQLQSRRSFKHSPAICINQLEQNDSSDNNWGGNSDCVWRRSLPSADGKEKVIDLLGSDNDWLVHMSRQVKEHTSTSTMSDLIDLCDDDNINRRLFGEGGMDVLSNVKVWSRGGQSRSPHSRLLCMIYTQHARAMESANRNSSLLHAIVSTWAVRCDGFLAFSDKTDSALGAVDTGTIHVMVHGHANSTPWVESYDMMWTKAQLIWTVVAMSDLVDVYDFFLLGGDDLFVVPENVQQILRSARIQKMQGPRRATPVYLGREVKANAYHTFHSGGSGYVLNQAAVATLFNLIHPPHGVNSGCLTDIFCSMEDLMVGRCLREAGVFPTHTRSDSDGLETFHPLSPQDMHDPREVEWFQRMAVNRSTGGDCCSEATATFHYIKSENMMLCMNFLINKSSHD